jgi:hypothetical protein
MIAYRPTPSAAVNQPLLVSQITVAANRIRISFLEIFRKNFPGCPHPNRLMLFDKPADNARFDH